MFSKITTYFLDSGRWEARETADGLLCVSNGLLYDANESICLTETEQEELETLLGHLRRDRLTR